MWGLISYPGNYFATEKPAVGVPFLPEKHHGLLLLTQLVVQTGLENPTSLYVLPLGSLNCDSHYLCGLLSAVLSPTHLLCGFFYTKSKKCCLLAFLSRPPPLNPNSVFPPHDYSKKNTYNSQQNHFRHVAFKFVQQNVFIFPFPLLGNPTPKQQHWK